MHQENAELSKLNTWTVGTYDKHIIPNNISEVYDLVLPYVQGFLCSDHPFRKGKVCPFVPSALKRDNIYFTYYIENYQNSVSRYIHNCITFYKNIISNEHGFGSLIILFPKDFPIEKLLGIHIRNKKQCVENHLMLGALWAKNQAQSLHDSNFYPLRTPTPILVIRDLTVQDLIFMDPKFYNIKIRISFLTSFIKKFNHKKFKDTEENPVKLAMQLRKIYIKKRFSKLMTIFIILMLALCSGKVCA